MNRPNLCAIAQLAHLQAAVARLIIAMCGGPFYKPTIGAFGPNVGREDVVPLRPGEKPGPGGGIVVNFSVRPEVAAIVKEFCRKKGHE